MSFENLFNTCPETKRKSIYNLIGPPSNQLAAELGQPGQILPINK